MPQQSTYNLYVLTKFMELIWLCIGTGVVISSTIWYIQRLEDDKYSTLGKDYVLSEKDKNKSIYLAIAAAALVTINLLYNQLLINLRFRCKMSCVTFGLCFYDCINCLQCFYFLKPCCIDRFSNKYGCFKIFLTLGVCCATIADIIENRNRWEYELETSEKF